LSQKPPKREYSRGQAQRITNNLITTQYHYECHGPRIIHVRSPGEGDKCPCEDDSVKVSMESSVWSRIVLGLPLSSVSITAHSPSIKYVDEGPTCMLSQSSYTYIRNQSSDTTDGISLMINSRMHDAAFFGIATTRGICVVRARAELSSFSSRSRCDSVPIFRQIPCPVTPYYGDEYASSFPGFGDVP
jgi:hypothetical protein